ncbi:MAG: AAA family ATPase, partial [Actinobacteria bacterium]|nr:AAA family ATPase [Actinomycetota bacterium]
MARCPSCAEVVPDGAKFCPECGTPLTASALEPRRERKIVSVVFVDLAGFTARSHAADPEDVSGPLRAFHAQVKRQIEHYGGTLDKFIGDGVLGVFGTPVAHEDDAERSVRAALRIVSAVDELNEGDPALDLAVRVAVNTGEAVVAVERGARTEESVVGDVVNTASRLEQVAPVGGVIVGEGTYLPTRDCIRYEELDPVRVKGKPDPLSVWRALSPVSRHSMRLRPAPTPFIGRRYESDLLESMFQRTVTDRTPHLITLTGEPGVGKSRIVAELAARLDARDEMIMWRQGRSLPYGEGVTF